MPEEIQIQQWEHYEGEDWWQWAVWVEGADAVLDAIEYVEWTLHPTFPKPCRRIHDRPGKFRLETGGWGVFPIIARVRFKDGRETKLRHQLKLHYPNGKETDA
jgi:transcription initiation factor IIF auxiliary subunit